MGSGEVCGAAPVHACIAAARCWSLVPAANTIVSSRVVALHPTSDRTVTAATTAGTAARRRTGTGPGYGSGGSPPSFASALGRLPAVDLEEKYAVALGVLSIVILGAGWLLGLYFRTAPPRIVRVVFPIAALLTLGAFAAFVMVARYNVKGF